MISKESSRFIRKYQKWQKLDLIVSLLIFVFSIILFIKSFIEKSNIDIAIYSFICGSSLCWFAATCINKKWLKIIEEIKKENKGL